MPALASMRSLTFAFGDRIVVDRVTLSLEAGQVTCLLGPNGAGKSTLIKLLCGTLYPTEGAITFAEGVSRRDIGLVPQNLALYPFMTATENCRVFARFAGLPPKEAATASRDALSVTECLTNSEIPVRRLSGGFQRRVNIAAALATRPQILVLDEPTVGIDLDARNKIAAIVNRLCDQGVSILFVTHDFAEADAVGRRLAFLSGGRMLACDLPQNLVDQVFGHMKRIEIVLKETPGSVARGSLRDLGATVGQDADTWHAFEAIDGWNADGFADKLAKAGVDFKEIRLRSPGAEALYRAFCGTEHLS